MIVLRAALGRDRPRSRARVAQITGVSVRRVARIERRGLKELRALGRHGGCAVTLTTVAPDATQAVAPGAAVTPLALTIPARTQRIEVKGEHVSVDPVPPPALESAKPVLAGPPEAGTGGGSDGRSPLLAVIPLLLLGYLAWTVKAELRRR